MSGSSSSRLGLPSGISEGGGFDSFLSDSSSSGVGFLVKVVVAAQELEDTARSTRRYIDWDREAAHEKLMNDYFVEKPKFTDEVFEGRFRLPKALFLKIVRDVEERFEWFQKSYDARLKKSFTALQKCTSALRQLASGNVPDDYDEYLAMSARTSRECLAYFCNALIILYRDKFLRKPTSHDIQRLYNAHEARWGLPGMIGSIDCTHVVWRMCPTELRGQFMRGDHKYPTIMLEAIVSHDLWFWHSFFGPAGSNNDLNVLHQSLIFNDDMHGTAPQCPFQVNGRQYGRGYYLANGIYPAWSVFVKAFSYPTDPKEKQFKKRQESARKDVERGFGVLKAKWKILERPIRAMKRDIISGLMYACIILNNMLLKHENRAICPDFVPDPPIVPVLNENIIYELRDEEKHFRLRYDLVEHVATLPDWSSSDLEDD